MICVVKFMRYLFTDRKFKVPRYWSNEELKKFAHLFKGSVINVSAWKDVDKQGKNMLIISLMHHHTLFPTLKKICGDARL